MKNRNTGILLSYLYTFMNMVSGLFISSLLLQKLGDSEYGLYQTVSAFATYLVMLEFGTGTVMSRNIAVCQSTGNDVEEINKNVSTIWYITAFLAVVIAAISVVFYFNIGNIYSNTMSAEQVQTAQSVFVVIVLYLIASFFTQTLRGILLGMEEYSFSQILNLVRVILRTAMLAAFVCWKPYSMTIVLIDLFFSVAIFLVTYIFCRKKFPIKIKLKYFDKKILIGSLPMCMALLLQTIVNQANGSVDKFIIGIKMSMESVALYSIAQFVYSIFSSATTIPIPMYLPQTAKDIALGKEGRELTDTFIQPCRLMTILGGSIMFGFIAVGRQFISIVYGPSRTEAWLYALFIIVPIFFSMTNGVLENVLDVLKKRRYRSYILIGTTAINIVLTVVLIDIYGIIGAVIATAISTVIGPIIIMNIYYYKCLNLKVLHLFYRAYKGILIYQIIACAVSFAVASVISNSYISFFSGGFLYVFLSGAMIIFFSLNKQEKEALRNKLRRYKNKGGPVNGGSKK